VSARARSWTALVPVCLALALASCSPPPRPGSAVGQVQARWEAARGRRETLVGALQADVVARVDGRATGRLPALTATLALAAPDRVRFRVGALLGVALDLLVRGDSLYAWVPSERLGFRAAGDSLGLGSPAAFAARILGATWAPPPDAWLKASADSAGWRVAWREGPDSLVLHVNGEALPLEVWIGRDGRGVRVRYTDWTRVSGAPFPARWELADDTGWARVRLDLDDAYASARPDSGWFALRRGEARMLGWEDMKTMLERGGVR
jgi:hypothetical protein